MGLAAVGQLYLTCVHARLAFAEWRGYALFLLGGTLAFYGTHRLVSLWRLAPKLPSARWGKLRALQPWLVSSVVLGTGLAGTAFWFSPQPARQYAWIPGLLSLGYILPLFGRGRRLRDFGLLKPFWLTAAWVALVNGPALLRDGQQFVLERSCLVLAIVLAFDYRDVELDRAAGVTTWPQLLGERYSGGLILLLFALSAYLSVHGSGSRALHLALGITSSIGAFLWAGISIRSRVDDLAYDFGVDGLLVFAVPAYWLVDGLL